MKNTVKGGNMPDIDWNIFAWNEKYDWSNQGEEWSSSWGSSFCQWLTTIYPRIASFFPAGNVLEIAPGFGRWTRFLITGSKIYRGVDVSEKCVLACRKRFEETKHASFYINNGKDLSCVKDIKYNFVFSFDSLVHADIDVLRDYITQIINMLEPKGVAFLHHSNLGMYADTITNKHCRSSNVSAKAVENIIKNSGGHLLTQEILTWGEHYVLNDCFSLFGKADDYHKVETRNLVSKVFMEQEVTWARDLISNYHVG